MSEEIIIINNEPFYRIPNGTSYDYAPIPKEFKPYFERLQQENQQLKEELNKYKRIYRENPTLYDEIAPYIINECNLENKIKQYKSVLDEIREYIDNHIIATETEECILQILDKVKEND